MERGSGWHGVVLGALLLTTGALGTWRIWDGEIEDEHLALYDHPLQHLVAADQHRVLDDVATAVSWAATPELIPVLAVLAAIPWFLRTRRREPLLFAGAVVLASAAVMVLKIPVGRVRPPVASMVNGVDRSFSFPSGHGRGVPDLPGVSLGHGCVRLPGDRGGAARRGDAGRRRPAAARALPLWKTFRAGCGMG